MHLLVATILIIIRFTVYLFNFPGEDEQRVSMPLLEHGADVHNGYDPSRGVRDRGRKRLGSVENGI